MPCELIFFVAANSAVRLACLAHMRLRKNARMQRKMRTQPSIMSKISHHTSHRPVLIMAGELIPVIVGSGTGADDPEMETRSERHTPRPGTTLAVEVVIMPFTLQLAATQVPPQTRHNK